MCKLDINCYTHPLYMTVRYQRLADIKKKSANKLYIITDASFPHCLIVCAGTVLTIQMQSVLDDCYPLLTPQQHKAAIKKLVLQIAAAICKIVHLFWSLVLTVPPG